MARPKGFLLHPPAFRALLAAKGLAQRDIAERSGRSVTTISGLYKQNHRASAATAQSIATAIGCEAEAVFPEMSGQFTVTVLEEAS